MGGSLGGNMSFRLGRRPNIPWLPRAIVWSPASIWDSLGAGADVLKHQGPRQAMMSAGDFLGSDPDDLSPRRLQKRAAFFGSWDQPTFELLGVPFIPGLDVAQSDTWQSDYYLCKHSGIAGARLDRHETYDAKFITWRWRLGGEQLLSSHQTIDATTKMRRYMSNCKPMLLSCGFEDHVPYNDICPATRNTAPYMRQTPGRAIFLEKTGHSLDNERRAYFATEIQNFLGEHWDPSSCQGPEKKRDGETCALGDDCASNWCYGFKCQTKHTKPNGSVCAIPDECASNRCIITCQAQPRLKGRGEGCTLPGECASHKCDFLQGVFNGLKCY
jgi:hypothetical protein